MALPASIACADEAIQIGVLAYRPKAQALQRWQPLSEYLKQKLGRDVEITTYAYSEFESAILQKQIDVVITNPAHYILLRHRNNLSAPLVTQVSRRKEHKLAAFGGVIFTRADNNAISSLNDIVDKTIAATIKESFGGYKMQAYELLVKNLPLPTEKQLHFTGMPHDQVVAEVIAGKADVGFVRTGLLESMSDEGKINLSQLKIINRQALPSFPFAVSTHLYPEWPVAAMPKVQEQLSRDITIALLSLPSNHPAALQAGIHGFTVPADYSGVGNVLRTLRVQPFDSIPDFTLIDLWHKYTQWILISFFLTLLLVSSALKLIFQNRLIKQNQKHLLTVQNNLASTLDAIPDLIFELGLDGTYYNVLASQRDLLVDKPESLLGKRVSDVMPIEAAAICLSALQKANYGQVVSGQQIWLDLNGEKKWFELSTSKKQNVTENLSQPHFIMISRDVTERKKNEEKLLLSSRVFNEAKEGIMVTDAQSLIIDVNPAFCNITEYSYSEAIGKNPNFLQSNQHSAGFYAEMWESIHETGSWQGEIWNRKKSGEAYAGLLSICSLTDLNGEIINYLGVFSDITDSKKQQDQLNLIAHYDVLTRLPNRILFADRFQQALAHSKRSKTQLAICFLDLDNFKPVNDHFGHDTGDKLLVEVANRITTCIREEDTVSRQGGDEFTLLLNGLESAHQCEQTLERLHCSLAEPYVIDGRTHHITASSGFTMYPMDKGDIDTLLRHADQAMYQSKQSGRNCYRLFNAELDQETVLKHHQIAEVQQALINNEFVLYYQPKVNMISGDILGAEALIRWLHPKKGLIAPLNFLPLIDGTKLEIELGDWVINQVLRQMTLWQQQGVDIEVSVNIASHHLQSQTFTEHLAQALTTHSTIAPQQLQLEILESSALGDIRAIRNVINTCQNTLGVSIALDDFGTGYSSLTHLRNLPANIVKIDQSFVRDLQDDFDDYTIIEGIIGLANSFSRDIIAEGVETANQGLMLITMGCKKAQGYGISKPLAADDFLKWTLSYQPNDEWQQFNKENLSHQQKKIKIFGFFAERLKANFANNISSQQSGPNLWPVSTKADPCSRWLIRENQEKSFALDRIEQLKQSYDDFVAVANNVLEHHNKQDLNSVQTGLTKLQLAFEQVQHILDQFN